MTQASQVIVNQTRAPQRDKPRRENMRRVRIAFRKELGPNAQTVIAGKCLKKAQADEHGSVPLTAYESDIPRIQALVEDDTASLEAARRAYENGLLRHFRESLGANHPPGWTPSLDPSEWDADMKQAEMLFGESVESHFYAIAARGIKPLESVEVDDEVLDPPMSDHEESVAAVARMMGGAGTGAGGADVAAQVIAQLVELGAIKVDAPKPKRGRKKADPKSDTNGSDD